MEGGIYVTSVAPNPWAVLWGHPGKDKLRQSDANTNINTNLRALLRVRIRNLVTILNSVIMPSGTRPGENDWATSAMRQRNVRAQVRSNFW